MLHVIFSLIENWIYSYALGMGVLSQCVCVCVRARVYKYNKICVHEYARQLFRYRSWSLKILHNNRTSNTSYIGTHAPLRCYFHLSSLPLLTQPFCGTQDFLFALHPRPVKRCAHIGISNVQYVSNHRHFFAPLFPHYSYRCANVQMEGNPHFLPLHSSVK